MGKYFGTDGFRGEANVTLTVEHAYKVGRFLGWYFGQDHRARIVIGKDTRRSSYMFEYSLVAGLTASGADAYLLHVTSTPSVSYVVRSEGFDCGIMISASHNPFYDNGIKVINGSGYKMEAEVEEKIEAYIDGETGEIPFAKREKIGRTVDYAIGRNRYIGYLISLATRSFKKVKVGLELANGSATTIAKGVFDALEAVSGAPGAESAVWQLAVNPWSESGSRLHYTPLWYPDGEYTLLSQAFYAWSPAGQMYWYDAASVNILGDMYDRVTAIEGR